MATDYLLGIGIAIGGSCVAAFFSSGGLACQQNFSERMKNSSRWIKIWIALFAGMVMAGFYGVNMFGLSRAYVGFILMVSYLSAMTVTDVLNRDIPDDASAFYFICFLIFQVSSLNRLLIMNALLGFVVGAAFPYLAHVIKKESIGLGDVKMLACIGLIAGFPGIFYIVVKGFFVMGVYSLYLLICKRGSLHSEIPLAPFVLIGALL